MARKTGGSELSRADVREIARRLNAALGGTLVSVLAGSQDATASRGWAKVGGPHPSVGAVERLVLAHEQWRRIADAEGLHVARAWFVGANPWLQNDTPVNAIREGRLVEVTHAAQAVLDDSFGG